MSFLWGAGVQAESLLIKEVHPAFSMGRRGASRKSPNKGGPPMSFLWGAGVQAGSLLIKEVHPCLLYGAQGCKQKVS